MLAPANSCGILLQKLLAADLTSFGYTSKSHFAPDDRDTRKCLLLLSRSSLINGFLDAGIFAALPLSFPPVLADEDIASPSMRCAMIIAAAAFDAR